MDGKITTLSTPPTLTGWTLSDWCNQMGSGLGQQLFARLHRQLRLEKGELCPESPRISSALGEVTLPKIHTRQESKDGVVKWLLGWEDGAVVECVLIPEGDRGTLCLSCQAGCSLGCLFCATGRMGLKRQLAAHEIVEQALLVRQEMAKKGGRVTNVVMMGMGEPLYNWEAVAKALEIIAAGLGLGRGSRKITVSTVGVPGRLHWVARDLGANLTISLHSVRQEVRARLFPMAGRNPLSALREEAAKYPLGPGRVITWGYLLLDGINDSEHDAEELLHWIDGIPSRINLLPFNPWPGSGFSPSPEERVDRFFSLLNRAGVVTTLRQSRGGEIFAACGQLRGGC